MKHPTTVVALPGASLMHVQLDGDILVITCPSCHESFRVVGPWTGDANFVHQDGCPIHARIQALLLAGAPTSGGVQ